LFPLLSGAVFLCELFCYAIHSSADGESAFYGGFSGPMPTIQINPNYFIELGTLPFPLLMWRLFLDGGWVPVLIVLWQGFTLLWQLSRIDKYAATLEFVLLAIQVPKTSDQTAKAAEQIFAHLSSTYSGQNFVDKWWHGKFTPSFSFEIVSLDGFVQFYIHCPKKARDLVEASIYAQYPDAEIIETADYTSQVPSVYPDPEWDANGTEYVLKKDGAYPIKTHRDFEHKEAEVSFKDPTAAVLEMLGSLKPGEQFWLQFRVTPTDEAWQKKAQDEVDKMLGKKKAAKKSFVDDILEIPMGVVQELTGLPLGGGAAKPEAKAEAPKISSMSPREKKVLEEVQEKISKIGFMCKIRVVYAARRNVFNKGRLGQFKAALAVFGAPDLNSFKGYGPITPKGEYFWDRWSEGDKKSALVRNFKNRSGRGATAYPLNVEELATLWHFPMTDVKAPLVKKTEAKRAEPPAYLPFEGLFPSAVIGEKPPAPEDDEEGAPGNLPIA